MNSEEKWALGMAGLIAGLGVAAAAIAGGELELGEEEEAEVSWEEETGHLILFWSGSSREDPKELNIRPGQRMTLKKAGKAVTLVGTEDGVQLVERQGRFQRRTPLEQDEATRLRGIGTVLLS